MTDWKPSQYIAKYKAELAALLKRGVPSNDIQVKNLKAKIKTKYAVINKLGDVPSGKYKKKPYDPLIQYDADYGAAFDFETALKLESYLGNISYNDLSSALSIINVKQALQPIATTFGLIRNEFNPLDVGMNYQNYDNSMTRESFDDLVRPYRPLPQFKVSNNKKANPKKEPLVYDSQPCSHVYRGPSRFFDSFNNKSFIPLATPLIQTISDPYSCS